MTRYYRIMLGRKSIHAAEAITGSFIGADFTIKEDLSDKLPDEWREFNKAFIPVFMANKPDKTKVAAGLAMGALWTVSKGITIGDIVLCPDGKGRYRVGEVTGDYQYAPGKVLPHRRPVRWLEQSIERANMSEALQYSTGSIGTVSNITKHATEVERLVGRIAPPAIVATNEEIEDPVTFALEKHLEEFLVQNWHSTELSKEYDIYEEDGERVGQQYETDTGPIDILALSKDKKKLLVVELKKGRATDVVVGQVLRYMGYVKEELAEDDQSVHGVVIALEDDQRLRRALAATANIDFYRYQVNFKLYRA